MVKSTAKHIAGSAKWNLLNKEKRKLINANNYQANKEQINMTRKLIRLNKKLLSNLTDCCYADF